MKGMNIMKKNNEIKNFPELLKKVRISITYDEITKNSKQGILDIVEQNYKNLKTQEEDKVKHYTVCYEFLKGMFLFDMLTVQEYLKIYKELVKLLGIQ